MTRRLAAAVLTGLCGLITAVVFGAAAVNHGHDCGAECVGDAR